MRYLGILALTAAAALGQTGDFSTGQAARLVIGQRTFTAQQPGASDTLLGAVGGVAYANDTLVLADSNRLGASPINHRVLVYKNLSSNLPAPTAEIAPDSGRCPVCTGKADVVLGQANFTAAELKPASNITMRLPTAVATDGRFLAVADTDNNRVLIWNSIPTVNGAPANVVVGQPDFQRAVPNDGQGFTPTSKSLKGPQGVWIQDGRLLVADTGNNRILIWNRVPSANGQTADLVLGQSDFNSFVQPDLTKTTVEAKPTNMLTPVSVSSDGQRLYVADLGHNRVLVWNSIPTANQAPADLALGQPDMQSAVSNNSTKVCASKGKDKDEKDFYPQRCEATLEFPRFALSDGRRLFIADGGNDRILIYNSVPTQSGAAADAVIGQLSGELNLISDSADPRGVASAGAVRTPVSLAWDGTNLYASDPFNRRVMVFTMAERRVPNTGVRNAASRAVYAIGVVSFSGQVKENDEVTLKIQDREYKYKALKDDKFDKVIRALVDKINAGAGDPGALATPNLELASIILTARIAGPEGNEIEYSTTVSEGAQISIANAGVNLAGGQDAAKIAPGTIVSLFGENLSPTTASAPADARELPRELAGVQVYFDGIRAPLFFVAPGEIRAQIPVEVLDAESVNAYIRVRNPDGSVTVTTAVAVPIITENPGIFAVEGVVDPRPGLVMHSSSSATGTVSVDGSVKVGDTATVVIEDRSYTYTVKEADKLETIRDGLVELVNKDPKVEAFPAGVFTRIRLRARVPGPEGNDILYTAKSNDGGQVILTATTPRLCCANVAGAPVTEANPALPGETIVVFATGLGLVIPLEAREAQLTGIIYEGPEINEPVEFVSSLAGGKTANVLFAGLRRGTVGLYEVHLELNSDLPTNPLTQLTIAQSFQVSNIIAFALFNPSPSVQ